MRVRLESILKEICEKTTENNQYPVLTSSKSGLFLQSDYFNKQVASKENIGYKVIRRGQFTYRAMSDTGEFFPNMLECTDIGIVSPAYPVFAIVDEEQVLPGFLKYYFKTKVFQHSIASFAQGSTRTSVKYDKLKTVSIDLSTIDQQAKTIAALDRARAIIDRRRLQLTEMDALVKARFVELFGDLDTNEKGWQQMSLASVAEIVSGITKGRKTKDLKLSEVPYMAVSNVKDGYIDWTTVKTILATDAEIEQYRLYPGDVLMTEGGDPDKLGRGAIIYTPMDNCIHQNHIFRVRLNREIVIPEYFAEYLQHQKAKRYFLRCAKQTTGIASINMRQLKELPLLCPPICMQNQFAAFVSRVDKSKVAVQKALDEAQLLFDSLMQEYFG